MPLYFFHLRDGEDTLIDAEGMELEPDDVEATALIQARDIIGHEVRKGYINLAQKIDVLDEAGKTVCSLNFEDAVDVRK
jgi:hypothetical protein